MARVNVTLEDLQEYENKMIDLYYSFKNFINTRKNGIPERESKYILHKILRLREDYHKYLIQNKRLYTQIKKIQQEDKQYKPLFKTNYNNTIKKSIL